MVVHARLYPARSLGLDDAQRARRLDQRQTLSPLGQGSMDPTSESSPVPKQTVSAFPRKCDEVTPSMTFGTPEQGTRSAHLTSGKVLHAGGTRGS